MKNQNPKTPKPQEFKGGEKFGQFKLMRDRTLLAISSASSLISSFASAPIVDVAI